MKIDLTRLKPGETGIITEIDGGQHMNEKLLNMGLRLGKKITKVSSSFLRGPQTVEIDNLCIAIGWGMAKRIFIEVKRNE